MKSNPVPVGTHFAYFGPVGGGIGGRVSLTINKEAEMARRSSFELNENEEKKLEEVKIQICLAIRRAMGRQSHYSSTVTAMKLGTSRACVSRVQRAIAKDLTFNQLFRYLVRLEPNFKILVAI